jgi:PAS domain S-box-containing protein
MESSALPAIKVLLFPSDTDEANLLRKVLHESELDLDLQFATKETDFIKRLLKFEPHIIIASNKIPKYNGLEIYKDVRVALPHAFFILTSAETIGSESPGYVLSGIDCFLASGDYKLLPLIILQGYNKKYLDQINARTHNLLLERKARLRAAFNSNQNAIFILGIKGEIVDINPAAQDLLEVNRDKLLGTFLIRYIQKTEAKKYKTAFASGFRGKETCNDYVFAVDRKLRKNVSLKLVPIRNEERHVTSLMAICKDVTDTFLFRRKFKTGEERFLALADHAPVGIFYENEEGKTIFANKVWTKISGLTFKQSLGLGWTKAIHPEDLEFVLKSITGFRKNNEPFVIDYRIIDKQQNIKWLRARSSPFKDENGKVIGYVGTVSNVTREKTQTLELELSQKRQKMALRLSGLGFVERNLKNNKVIWSPEVFKMFELDPKEEVPDTETAIKKYLHPEDLEKVRKDVKMLRERGGQIDTNYRIIAPSGKIRHLRSISTIENDLNGIPDTMYSTVQDITQQFEKQEFILENEAKFRQLFNDSPDAIYLEDFNGNILEVSEEACRIQGVDREQLIGKNLRDIAPAEKHDEIFRNFKKLIHGEINELRSFSWKIDGTKIPVTIRQRIIRYKKKPAILLSVRPLEKSG